MNVQTKPHPLATLLVGANNVMLSKDEGINALKRVATLDDKSQGNNLALETLALCKGQARPWSSIANRLFDLTIEGRAFYVKALSNDLKETGRTVVDAHDVSDKRAKKLTASAMVRVSQCKKIANAITAGMTRETVVRSWLAQKDHTDATYNGLVDQAVADFENTVGFDAVQEVAGQFVQSSGKGRPKLGFAAKLAKWLEQNAPEDESPELAVYAQVVDVVNKVL